LWAEVRNRDDEEEWFLVGVLTKAIGYFGKLDWPGLQWALRDEQRRLGDNLYVAFWKDWELCAILE
jgi:hypothetical protein